MPKKILIIRFSSIGDIVLTTPVIRCLKTQLPGVEVHYATKKQFAGLLSANPYIDKIHSFEEKKLPALIEALDAEHFDYIVDLHNNFRSFLIRSNLGLHYRAFRKLNVQKWLMVTLKINRLPDIHIVDRYMETVAHLGVRNDGKGLDHFIPEGQHVPPATLPTGFQSGYAAFVIGAMHATKKLPVEKAVALTQTIDLPVILIGGPDDTEAGEAIVAASSNRVFNACGKFSIHQSASLLQQALRVYSHDTGMMHIAAALKKDVTSIWGNTIPAFGMYPYYGDALSLQAQYQSGKILEVTPLACRPCSKIGYDACPKGHFRCMQDIDFSQLSKG